MKRSKTHVDNLGIQALANVYPNELGRIMFLSTNTGKVVLHYFMDSDDPSMKLISAENIILRAAVKAAVAVFVPANVETEAPLHRAGQAKASV